MPEVCSVLLWLGNDHTIPIPTEMLVSPPILCWRQNYSKTSCISRTKSQKSLVSSCSCLYPIHWSQVVITVKYEDVVGAAQTGNAPTTSEWSTILLHTKVRLILEVLRYGYLYRTELKLKAPDAFNIIPSASTSNKNAVMVLRAQWCFQSQFSSI